MTKYRIVTRLAGDLLYAVIFVGWGIKKSDDSVLAWNQYVDEGDFRFPEGEDG